MEKPEHFMSTVRVGPKGQIVIPKQARVIFDIAPGDMLLLLADAQNGIALHRADRFIRMAESIMSGGEKEMTPGERDDQKIAFARQVKQAASQPEESEENERD
jgi:AbrB family looped-hinge helix DNA binding protein